MKSQPFSNPVFHSAGRGSLANHLDSSFLLSAERQCASTTEPKQPLYNPILSGTNLLLLNGYNGEDRPDRICNGSLSHPTAAQWFNPPCFVLPIEPTTPGALLREGTAGYDILRGPGTFAEDLALIKTTPVNERLNVEFRAEFFNVFNHPVLGLPNNAINPFASSSTVGEITNPASLPRIIQFALKLHF
jgi:hypothetical protein